MALLIAAVAGCGAGGGSTDHTPPKEEPRLPIDRYRQDDDFQRYSQAHDLLVQRCMVRLGFTGFPRHPQLPSMGMRHITMVAVSASTPYGRLDLDQARRWGYGWDPKKKDGREPDGRPMTEKEYAAVQGDPPRKGPKGGCNGQADRRLYRGVKDEQRMWSYATGREVRLEKAAQRDPRVRRALKTWSRCVEDKGFARYATPRDAFRDKRWSRASDGNTTRTKREVGTAVADVECKGEHHTVEVWSSVLAERQRTDIARHRATYDAVRRDLDTMRSNAGAVLGR
ncbi:hypothetical protein HUT19_06875 [Streptomyces sp. NA02950]|uniref:hypothetical protein n=1 Tax=Streptomyces sp. NA02950 TaxID=2742137 RepID=UPI001591BA0C|nr:hypothetical protein [Streptomyces sp. NA02950]QKV91506.1 hypothetical protein HUT19_06875 [Streptomyces sp. NA02950]